MSHATPSILKWARETAGYDLEKAVEKLKWKTVSTSTLDAWENGVSSPTYTQLKKLAKTYQRPIALFYFPQPPQETNVKKKFRAELTHNLSPKMHFLIRKAEIRQMDLEELHMGHNTENAIAQYKGDHQDAKALATKMRQRLGISIATQKSWKDADEALKHWRAAVEGLGVWVFKDSFADNKYCGFCLNHDQYPVIYIYNGDSKQRQIFTLFHELGHILKGQNFIDFRDEYSPLQHDREEVFCNAFASELLIPNSEKLGESEYPGLEGSQKYATQFKVSIEVILRKYRDANKVSQTEYSDIISDLRSESSASSSSSGGGNYYPTQIAYLGERYLELAFKRFYEGVIDNQQLTEYTGIKNTTALQDYLVR